MKTKISFLYILSISFLLTLLISCDDENVNEQGTNTSAELVIKTGAIPLNKTLKSALISEFTEGSRLGLFITKGSLGDSYSSDASLNILSEFTGGTWRQTPSVNLYSYNATIYAYYPYSSGNLNGKEIPVQSGLTDYMYGTHTAGQQNINKDNSTVSLTMNHAGALVQFNLYKSNYPWNGNLERVSINNATNKSVIHYSGKLNIQTGEITNLAGTDRAVSVNSSPLLLIPDIKSANEDQFIKLFLLPTQKTASKGDVIVTFSIDNREYNWEVPAGTEWLQGTKNTYDVQLNGNELRIGEVKVANWTDGINGDVIIE